MADNRKRAPRGGKQAASGSRPIRRNDRAAASKGQRERSQAQAARSQRDRNRDNIQVPKGEFIEGRRAAAEALRTGFPIKCALIAEGGERDAALSRLVDDLNAAVSALSMCRARSSMRCRAMALTRALRSRWVISPMLMSPISSIARVTDRRSSSCSTM